MGDVHGGCQVDSENVQPDVGVCPHASVMLKVLLQRSDESLQRHGVVTYDVDRVGLPCSGGQQCTPWNEGRAVQVCRSHIAAGKCRGSVDVSEAGSEMHPEAGSFTNVMLAQGVQADF